MAPILMIFTKKQVHYVACCKNSSGSYTMPSRERVSYGCQKVFRISCTKFSLNIYTKLPLKTFYTLNYFYCTSTKVVECERCIGGVI